MINLNFNGIEYSYENSKNFIHSRGGIYHKNKYLTNNDFDVFLQSYGENKILNGSYCFIKKNGCKIIVSVDCVRSIPIFYSKLHNQIFLSDKANWIESKISKRKYDSVSKKEFWLSGFVLGNKTIHTDIYQIPAGNILLIDLEKKFFFNLLNKFQYSLLPSVKVSFKNLLIQHESIFYNCIKRLILRANGRTIVVPLSNGLDSRLIALQLKLNNYNNVICFSYGKRNNKESNKSKQTAKKLGFKWVFVEYNRSLWFKTYNSDLFKNYFFSADNLSSLAHIQDWVAVKYLTDNKIIPNESIIVPGHTGDFLANGHIPPNFEHVTNIKTLVDEIIIKHFRVNSFKSLCQKEKISIKNKINDVLKPKKNEFDNDYAKQLFQYFDWSERQSKFIVNSVRVYDFFNFQWALPFWDLELINFWRKINFKYKENKFLYKSFLKNIDTYNIFDDVVVPIRNKKISSSKIIGMYKFLKSNYILFKLSLKKRFLYFFTHHLQWYGILNYTKIIFHPHKIQNINTFLVNTYLKKKLKSK